MEAPFLAEEGSLEKAAEDILFFLKGSEHILLLQLKK